MSSRIEQIIQEIEEYVDSCKFQPLSTTKIVVNKEEIEEYLRELRLKTPDEIKRYQKIISNKDAILVASEILTSDDFYQKQYGIIFDAMVELLIARKVHAVCLILLKNIQVILKTCKRQ